MVISFQRYKETRNLKLSVTIPFGERLMLARKNQGMTQEQLAARVGVDRSVISRWETGASAIRPAEMANVALALGNIELLEHFCQGCPVCKAYEKLNKKLA